MYRYLSCKDFSRRTIISTPVSTETWNLKQKWRKEHRRYFKVAGITIQIDSDVLMTDNTFNQKFKHFEARGPSKDMIAIHHYFSLPDLDDIDLGKQVYRKPPWAIYKNNDSWIYLGILPVCYGKSLSRVAVFKHDHSCGRIYNDTVDAFLKGNLHSLTLFPSDQVLIARILAERDGCYLHSCGVNFGGKGLLFVGHSEAGKSTMAAMVKGRAEILCDDRMIIRRYARDFKIFGTWSHGDVSEISADPTSLNAILFLNKSARNRLIPITDRKEIIKLLLPCVIKPFVTVDWWDQILSLIEAISINIPAYVLEFDKSGKVVELVKQL